ncbi:YjbH domain-containing protein [Pseudoalteromonas piscicida]|uniref:YjbH domain-containing protein n=1 Tax=Pseudoalteromonas piscicida TaxID=43662 RepID=UPI0027E54E25|nr:YjbH domain-containing protein [Pseudoalteromonas piscicida]WMO14768.1 YjbH domain-containing protein [Pseudoalteromonas piscicida]
MLKSNFIMLGSLSICCLPAMASEHLDSFQSFAGYTGLFNTPTAEVLEKGHVNFGYNNQLDLRGKKFVDGHNYAFSAGLFDGLEVGGFIAAETMHDNIFREEGRGQLRDLSFNIKYQLPFVPKEWFNLAIGAKDLGGK